MFARERVMLNVIIDLDPIRGIMHTPESARQAVESTLLGRMGHYSPVVMIAKKTEEVQPEDEMSVLSKVLTPDQILNLKAWQIAEDRLGSSASRFDVEREARTIADFLKRGR